MLYTHHRQAACATENRTALGQTGRDFPLLLGIRRRGSRSLAHLLVNHQKAHGVVAHFLEFLARRQSCGLLFDLLADEPLQERIGGVVALCVRQIH